MSAGWRPDVPLDQIFAYLILSLSPLRGPRVYACLADMQRTSVTSSTEHMPLCGRALHEAEPLSPVSVLEGLTPQTTPRSSLDEVAPSSLGKRKAGNVLRD